MIGMKRTLALFLGAALLNACGTDNAGAPSGPALQPKPLAVGGALPLAQLPGAELALPSAVAWAGIAESRVELSLAPPVHQSINLRHDPGAPSVPVFVQAAKDMEKIHLRLRWPDSSENGVTSRTEFADGVAVQFALQGGTQTSFMMGAPGGPVNIWYWKAGTDQAQNLAAGGFGSTTPLEQNGLSAQVARGADEWQVVFSRPLKVQGENQVDLASDGVQLALAVWQGNESQRDGLKHVTMGWIELGSEQ
jgi:dimethylsulfide dehydrogenase subunit gamma